MTGNMTDVHSVNDAVKYIDKLGCHGRNGKLKHQGAYRSFAKICCCIHFNFLIRLKGTAASIFATVPVMKGQISSTISDLLLYILLSDCVTELSKFPI